MLHYQPTYHDQTLDPLIQQILPQIEESLKKQLMAELQRESQLEFERELDKIERQAQEEYQLALHDLEEQGKRLEQQQSQTLQQQLHKLHQQLSTKSGQHYKTLQDTYISQNFQQKILNHPKIQQIQRQLAEQILKCSEQRFEQTKQRRMREIAVKMESKEQRGRKERDRTIKAQVFAARALEGMKKDIQVMRIGIASMKSEYNIKIKKIDDNIKEIKERNKVLQPKQNIHQLRLQLQILQNRRDQINQKILYEQQQQQRELEEEQKRNHKRATENTFSHLQDSEEDSSNMHAFMSNNNILAPPQMKNTQKVISRNKSSRSSMVEEVDSHRNNYKSNRNNQQQFRNYLDYDHRSISQQQQQNYNQEQQLLEGQLQQQQSYSNQYLDKPPVYRPSAEVSEQHLQTFQNHAPILKLNVASLLRGNWGNTLQKYIHNGDSTNGGRQDSRNTQQNGNKYRYINSRNGHIVNNENDPKASNKPTFQEVYHQHLQKLNQATKRRKLSVQAKRTLMKNLSMISKNKF